MSTTAPTFADDVRVATQAAHARAERSRRIRALADGTLDRDGYGRLLAQHRFVYAVLEAAADVMRRDPVAAPFASEELTRVPAIETDLAAFLGSGWTAVEAEPATLAYCDRLRAVAFDWPGGFVAHHYVRYLGDLSGGQFLRAVVRDRYGVTDELGAAAYVFDGIDDLTAFKDHYRRLLDAAPWDADERRRIVDEVLLGYELATSVLDGGS